MPAVAPAPVVAHAVLVDASTAPAASGTRSPGPPPELDDGAAQRFSGSAAEREALLVRRKEALLSAARLRYLERLSALAPSTTPAAPAPRAPPPC